MEFQKTKVQASDIPTIINSKLQTVMAESLSCLEEHRFGQNWIKPAYGSFCFAGLPGFIQETLTGSTYKVSLPQSVSASIAQGVDRIVFVFLDAFGWEAYERFAEGSDLMKTFSEDGLLCKTTSQFPSTTAAHVTTLNSGLPVYETGVCEWHYYEPNVDAVINPFQLRTVDTENKHSLLKAGHDISKLLPNRSLSSDLKKSGVSSFIYGPKEYFPSPYNYHMNPTAEMLAYDSTENAISTLVKSELKIGQKEYHYLYIGAYDSARHTFGPYSNEADNQALEALALLNRLREISSDGRTLVVLTADHGQVATPQETEVILNKEVPEILGYLRQAPDGSLIRFGGGPRDLFLYTKKGVEAEVKSLLSGKLSGVAEIYTQDEAAALGILGPTPVSSRFKDRMGNVLILPHLGHSVNWDEPGFYNRDVLLGHHGGLTAQEMETPLCMLRL